MKTHRVYYSPSEIRLNTTGFLSWNQTRLNLGRDEMRFSWWRLCSFSHVRRLRPEFCTNVQILLRAWRDFTTTSKHFDIQASQPRLFWDISSYISSSFCPSRYPYTKIIQKIHSCKNVDLFIYRVERFWCDTLNRSSPVTILYGVRSIFRFYGVIQK